ncbi:DUF2268 domain-containing putative Zn-dependent protease [Methylobacterium sp. Leaf112]|uniref:DUF2268 domain-containing putative Zn-dependent protease n=1 Tax=Methylobacterium sp. Leaf112 TaxID=1736258 RepID=UPI0006F27206|nr:DUF2268 domain-containing putative Zn-dependent protease [Methylobacterium sp. Leaf112]KQP62119.1 hypothetical protein ASF52_05525 [Methylobacterium sp. Leaf112]
MTWHLHWLEASGDLGPWRDAITAEVEIARRAIVGLVPVRPLDILVQRDADGVLPETGTGGRAYASTLFSLTIDPDNPNFAGVLADGDIRRTVVHEAHHCLRMAGPGYGWTLGEALVSEGLAGRFVERLFGAAPEPWENAFDDTALAAQRPDAALLAARDYDHAAWFFGSDAYPRWYGYTLGYRIAGDWVRANPGADGETWVNVPAEAVLAAARGHTLAAA